MINRFTLSLIKIYQKIISPLLPPICRYQPTCSHYASEAIQRFGAGRGLWLGIKRILRCHPFAKGGFDPVPPYGDELLLANKLGDFE